MRSLLLAFTLLLVGVLSVQAATFTVNSVSDSGPGTFSQAILDANANGSGVSDQITINLSAGPPIPTVNVVTPLPPITSPCEITSATSGKRHRRTPSGA